MNKLSEYDLSSNFKAFRVSTKIWLLRNNFTLFKSLPDPITHVSYEYFGFVIKKYCGNCNGIRQFFTGYNASDLDKLTYFSEQDLIEKANVTFCRSCVAKERQEAVDAYNKHKEEKKNELTFEKHNKNKKQKRI